MHPHDTQQQQQRDFQKVPESRVHKARCSEECYAVRACEVLSGRPNRSSCTLTRHTVCSARFQFRCELTKVNCHCKSAEFVACHNQATSRHTAQRLHISSVPQRKQYRQCRVTAGDLSAAGIAATTNYQLWFESGHRLALCHLQIAENVVRGST